MPRIEISNQGNIREAIYTFMMLIQMLEPSKASPPGAPPGSTPWFSFYIQNKKMFDVFSQQLGLILFRKTHTHTHNKHKASSEPSSEGWQGNAS